MSIICYAFSCPIADVLLRELYSLVEDNFGRWAGSWLLVVENLLFAIDSWKKVWFQVLSLLDHVSLVLKYSLNLDDVDV